MINIFSLFSMNPAETGKIAETDIYAFKNGRNNVFAFKMGHEYALIDAGSNVKTIKKSFEQLSVDTASVRYILLTHTDSDHVAALSLFPNAAVYMSEDEKQMIDGKVKRSSILGYNALPKEIGAERLVLLADNQELKFGSRTLRCIKTPGHTLGSMVYLLDGKYLFTGDAISISGVNISTHPFTMDENTAKDSINQINELKRSCQLIFTSHYGYMKIGH